MKRDNLDGIAVFVRVSQSKSFTEAARSLRISASAVSKAISRLEYRLDTRLIDRTTRRISLTAEGKRYLERCRRILEDLEYAEAELAEARRTPSGLLRVQVPRGFGRKIIIPALTDFLDTYPEIQVDVTVRDGAIDPAEEGVDVSFVLGKPTAGQFIARPLTSIGYVICASRKYLARSGIPQSLSDLEDHRCLDYLDPRTGKPRSWSLTVGGKPAAIRVFSVFTGNDILAVHQAVRCGAGIAYLMDFLIADDVREGELSVLLPETALRGVPVQVCYQNNPYQSPRVSAFVNFMLERFSAVQPWSIDKIAALD